jgi:DNA-binding CsgD family transcriptional regulator
LLATALTAAQRRGSSMIAELYEARGRLNLERRRPKDAFSDFCEAGRCATEVFECRNPAMLGWRGGAALAAHRFGAVAAARRLAEDEVQAARHFGERRALARALRIRGVLEPGDAGLALLHEALFVIATSSARLEHANVLVDLGDALRRAGRLAEARTHVRSAGDLADRLGAVALAARAGESLRLLGGRPRRLRVSGPLSLTPGELRVAERARGGATNTEIAQELFVSTKAVEFHLANVFRKLGIRSRRELPDALPRQDGPADDGAE